MHPARIAELLEPFLGAQANDQRPTTDDVLCNQISTYIDLLLRWNARINLTAIRSEEEIVTRHFGESLFAARHLFPKNYPVESPVPSVPPVLKDFDVANDQRPTTNDAPPEAGSPKLEAHLFPKLNSVQSPVPPVLKDFDVANDQRPTTNDAPPEAGSPKPEARAADLGTGPGFPGIPIKLWAPAVHMTLIESNHKKAAFLREVIRSLTLTHIDIKIDRAESIPGTYDLVTLRAVERFTSILPTAARLLNPSGRLALLIAVSQLDQAQSTLPSFTWNTPRPIPNSESRILLLGEKA
jgi:16S rRNA G527 N7-methylase RsmG